MLFGAADVRGHSGPPAALHSNGYFPQAAHRNPKALFKKHLPSPFLPLLPLLLPLLQHPGRAARTAWRTMEVLQEACLCSCRAESCVPARRRTMNLAKCQNELHISEPCQEDTISPQSPAVFSMMQPGPFELRGSSRSTCWCSMRGPGQVGCTGTNTHLHVTRGERNAALASMPPFTAETQLSREYDARPR